MPINRKTHLLLILLFLLSSLKVFAELDKPWISNIQSPQYFAVYVKDVESMMNWYSKVLGLKKLGGSAAEDGSWRIENLGNDKLLVEIIKHPKAAEASRPYGFSKVGFFVENLDSIADDVESATGNRPRIVDFELLEQQILQIKDPEGNTIQVMKSKG